MDLDGQDMRGAMIQQISARKLAPFDQQRSNSVCQPKWRKECY